MPTDTPDLTRDGLPLAPASERNKRPILEQLQPCLADKFTLLEIAAGYGQHAVHMAHALPHITWQCSERPSAADVLCRRIAHHKLANTPPPLILDAAEVNTWPRSRYQVLYTANSFHIMSWATVTTLLSGADRLLQSGGLLLVYGPFFAANQPAGEGNLRFDAGLRRENPAMGIRQIEQVCAAARQADLELLRNHPMPANNRLLVFIHHETTSA